MILFNGKILPDEELDNVLEQLWDACLEAVSNRTEIAELVINACGRVAEKIRGGAYDGILLPLLESGMFTNPSVSPFLY